MRAVLCNDIAIDEENLDTLADTEEAYREIQKTDDGLVEVRVGLEWLPLASEDLLRECRELANELGIGMHIHLSESMSEVEICETMYGKRPTEVAYDTGLLGPDCIAAHCVWMTDSDIALLKETGTQVSHNPTSNAKLGNGVARLPEMLEAGLNVGLGHDAAECNNSRDMFQVMKWSSLIHRATRVDASLQQAPDVLRMATRNGASALGHNTGELSAGKLADVILIDINNQYFTPLMPESKEHLYSHLVFSAEGSCVDTSIVNGRIVRRSKEFLDVDEEEIRAKANEAFRGALNRMVVPDQYKYLSR
jgi:5-methylthioadenosine/S-adenosylhomocysteine deaminase